MAKTTDKKVSTKVTKGPPGLHSFTVLFFEGRPSYLDPAITADAVSLNLSSVTAKYVETAPGDWSMCLVFRQRGGKAFRVARLMAKDSLRPGELLENFLAKELMIQSRLASQAFQETAQDRPSGRLAITGEKSIG